MASLPPWSFLPMGIGEPHCDCLALVMFDLATPWLGDAFTQATPCLGDALPWRRLFLTTLALSVSSPRQRLVLTLTPRVDFDLDLVNARVRDGTRPKQQYLTYLSARNRLEMLIAIKRLSFVLSCSYNYARDRQLWDILKDFICEESIKMIFIRASISIKELNIDRLIKILESERDETNPYFSNSNN